MGTNSVLKVITNNEEYTMFSHNDGFFEYNGNIIIDFIKLTGNCSQLEYKLAKCIRVGENQKPPLRYKEIYKKYYEPVRDLDSWYAQLRKVQGVALLIEILNDDIKHIPTCINYVGINTFIIDLKKQELVIRYEHDYENDLDNDIYLNIPFIDLYNDKLLKEFKHKLMLSDKIRENI